MSEPVAPPTMATLPTDPHGRLVPWFVAQQPGGRYDFRIADEAKLRAATMFALCWCCGNRLHGVGTFAIGPMCVVNHISAEPPNHLECAMYAVRVCPFLSIPNMRRRPIDHEAMGTNRPPGQMIERNPGVIALWTTTEWSTFAPDPAQPERRLHDIGRLPATLSWWCQGRSATRAEVVSSIAAGMPALAEVAAAEPGGMVALEAGLRVAMQLVPVH